MVQEYISKLINDLPENIKKCKTPIIIDLVLDGGAFNGAYLVGALFFLKEMEKQKYIKINRISGSSIGSIIALLYLTDSLHLVTKLSNITKNHFKEKYNLEIIKEIKKYLKDNVPDNMCDIVNYKLFITYNNIQNGLQHVKKVKYKYKDEDDIYNSIIKSSFVPFLVDGNILYKNKYIDGMNPYIFKKNNKSKILFLDLFGEDKIYNLLNIKNEKTDFQRILTGLLEMNFFFIKQRNTSMCSYVNDWSFYKKIRFYFKQIIEKIVILIIKLLFFISQHIPRQIKRNEIYSLVKNIVREKYISLIKDYCI
jgi:hypothetical protein